MPQKDSDGKKNKIIAIGNAIVDVVCEIDDSFLLENNLIKGSMSLIDEMMAKKLSALPATKTSSGGSAANTVTAIAQLGGNSAFIGKVALDDFGRKFIEEVEKTNTKFLNKKFANNCSAKSFILVTKDAQRTMCTFLGCASELDEDDLKEEDFRDAAILYLEGYLWDKPEAILVLKKAMFLAKKHGAKIAFTLSDFFCVARHKQDFLNLIKNDLGILFANEAEIKELLEVDDIEDNNYKKLREYFSTNKKLTAIVTRSDKGCLIFGGGFVSNEKALKVETLVDTTGAGDCFAAGFLYGLGNHYSLEKSAQLGHLLASKIIQKFGARFDEEEIKNLKII